MTPSRATRAPRQSTSSRSSAVRPGPALRGEQELSFLRARDGGLSAQARREVAIATIALATIAICSLLVVVMAADRPSIFSPASHTNFFPHWMAGPLGGIWPGLTRDATAQRYLFTAAIVVMYAGYLVALSFVPRLRARWAIAAIVAVHAIFLLAPPLALTDVFNYINYGRMEVVHHLNPYTTIPIAEPHSDPAFELSNWHELLSPYGPMFTILTFALVPLGVAGSFWAIKAILAAASLAIVLLVWRCARLLGRDPVAAIVLVGLNPIVLVWGLGGDHNDFLMVLLIMLGFYLLLLGVRGGRAVAARSLNEPRGGAGRGDPAGVADGTRVGDAAAAAAGNGAVVHAAALDAGVAEAGGRAGEVGSVAARVRGWLWPLCATDVGAGAAFVGAAAIKASGGILIPVVLAGLLRAPRRLVQVLVGMLAGAIFFGGPSLIAFGPHLPDLSTQSWLVTSVSVPNLIGLAIGAGGESDAVRMAVNVVLALTVAGCCVLAWRGRGSLFDRTVTASGWASVALLVSLSWVLPWYVLWLLPLAALSSSRRLRTATVAVGAYLIISWAPASGFLWSAIHFQPEKTTLGRVHQRYVKELLH
jgi:hypothetical protein